MLNFARPSAARPIPRPLIATQTTSRGNENRRSAGARRRCGPGGAGSDVPPPESSTTPGNSSPIDGLPEELQGLAINEEGLLIDERSGKVINEYGATRFDVAVRALRGELDPPNWKDNTDRAAGLILGSLLRFPASHMFSVVGRPMTQAATAAAANQQPSTSSSSSTAVPTAATSRPSLASSPAAAAAASDAPAAAGAFAEDVRRVVAAVCETDDAIIESVTPRLGGKYVSVCVRATVRAPDVVQMVHDELKQDARIKMSF